MTPYNEPPDTVDAILAGEEPSAWTLDELESSADLGSLRSAWAGSDDPNT